MVGGVSGGYQRLSDEQLSRIGHAVALDVLVIGLIDGQQVPQFVDGVDFERKQVV